MVTNLNINLEEELLKENNFENFSLHYQPKVNIQTGNISGVEALLRWKHPEHGWISPVQFIPLAEKTRFIIPLGKWVIEHTFKQLRLWNESLSKPLSMAINLSLIQFEDPELIHFIQMMIEKYSIAPKLVEFELTESVMIQNLLSIKSQLFAMNRMGVRIALDDFGVGYSSLSSLKDLPIHTLKLDKSFISEVETELNHQNIIKGIIQIAKSLQLNIVAEGVENEEQLKVLKDVDCHQYQGFYYSPPLAKAEFENLLIQSSNHIKKKKECSQKKIEVPNHDMGHSFILQELLVEKGYYGEIYKGYIPYKDMDVIVLKISGQMATFIEEGHIHNKANKLSTCPSMLRLIDLIRTDDELFIIYEYFKEMKPLSVYLTEGTYDQKINLMLRITEATDELHSRLMWHGSLIPEYIWVLPTNEIKLMTMLFPSTIQLLNAISVEENPFFAPELLKMHPIDSRSDIYNLGYTFLLLLIGSKEPVKESLTPSDYDKRIPDQLDRIILKMLHHKPSKRYQWIKQMLKELHLLMGNSNSDVKIEKNYGSVHLFYSEFIGRKKEVEEVESFYQKVINGSKPSMLIMGQEGLGRRRLIYEVSGTYSNIGYLSGTAKGASLSAIEEIVAKCLVYSLNSEEKRKMAKSYLPTLSSIFPSIKRKYEKEFTLTNKNFNGCIKGVLQGFLLEYLNTSNNPIVLEIYDAHKVDEISNSIFNHILASSKGKIGIIAISKPSETILMKEWVTNILDLAPLSKDELIQCLDTKLGSNDFIDTEFVTWIDFHSKGLLERAFYILDYLADTKQIYLEDFKWRLSVSPSNLEVPFSDLTLFHYHIEQLDPLSRKVCNVISLFRSFLNKEEAVFKALQRVCCIDDYSDLLTIINMLETKGILLEMMTHYQFPSMEEKKRVYQTIPKEEIAQLHINLAESLLAEGVKELSELAYLFEKGKDWKRAVAYYICDARLCYRNQMYQDALDTFEKASVIYISFINKEIPFTYLKLQAKILDKIGGTKDCLRLNLQIFEKTGSLKALNNFAVDCLNTHQTNLLEPYISVFEKGIKDKNNSLSVQVESRIVIGFYYMQEGKYEKLYELFAFYEENRGLLKSKLKPRKYVKWLYNLYVLLSYIPYEDEKTNKFIYLLYEVLSLAEKYNLKTYQTSAYNLLGIYELTKDMQKAKDYFLKSFSSSQVMGNVSNELTASINLIDCYISLGDFYQANKFIENADRISANEGYKKITLMMGKASYQREMGQYIKAEQYLKEALLIAKRNGQLQERDEAYILLFTVIIEQKNRKKAKRLWPVINHICGRRGLENEKLLIKSKYNFLYERFELVRDDLTQLINIPSISITNRIAAHLMLIEALIKLNQLDESYEMANQLYTIIMESSYYGALGKFHFLKAKILLEKNEFIECNLYLQKSLKWMRKYNQQKNLKEVYEFNLRIKDSVKTTFISSLGELSSSLLPLEQKNIEKKQSKVIEIFDQVNKENNDMIEKIVYNELLLDSMKRIKSTFDIYTLSKSIAAILFENLLFDQFHMKIIQSHYSYNNRITLNDQLQVHEEENEELEEILKVKMNTPKMVQGTSSNYYILPICSKETEEVIALVSLENYNFNEFSSQDKKFITDLFEAISSQIENNVLYQTLITDDLTGLYKRNYFMKRLEEEFSKCIRYKHDLSFLMIDLDNFRFINNTFGHQEGDSVLKRVCESLQNSIRRTDIAGRYGGEEFIVILPNTSGTEAKEVAERILGVFRNLGVLQNHYKVSASIGISCFKLDQVKDHLELIKKADYAELEAKRNGKDQIICSWEI
ncbi:EAL domain-containing protein [Bacillus sp. 31A1R]|uniref:EAL domain-containing protein n=1 Tax=Robertmurraya mangrovi TaxID=3098077 RepID=A0ABU5J2C2_9BACI|nr:EAL domain-containing protein [Bacillus sp. 31A1R]MDZ5473564.1 EAL domain-containing protein [Bacillus sp. 31A1R]